MPTFNKSAICLLLIGIFVLTAAGCVRAPGAAAPQPPAAAAAETGLAPVTPSPAATPTAAPSQTPAAALPPSPTPTTGPTHTPAATPIPPPEQALAELVRDPAWSELGLPDEQRYRWEAFAAGQARLEAAELRQVNDFLAQWRALQALAALPRLPEQAGLAWRTQPGEADDGSPRTLLYPVSPVGGVFLQAHTRRGAPAGLLLAPEIAGLELRIAPDGRRAGYYNPANDRLVMLAEARQVDPVDKEQQILAERLEELYRKNHPYVKAQLYPAYFFPIDEVQAAFFTLEQSLTAAQIVHMNDAFDLFNRPRYSALKAAMFGRETAVIVVDEISYAAGLTYTGSSLMELNRRDLFGNRYQLAEVLAHEGAHVLQGSIAGSSDRCAALLKLEVADQKIPADLLEWDGEQIVSAVRARQIGAYHVSLWMLQTLGIKGREIEWLRSVVQTGASNGEPIVMCGSK